MRAALPCGVRLCAQCGNRYVESIEDVMSVFIRLHLTNKAPHVVLVDDISTMQCRDKMYDSCAPQFPPLFETVDVGAALLPLSRFCATHLNGLKK